jgi:hypothetical protein
MAEIANLNTNDANNVARFYPDQKVPSLNDGGQALEGLLARHHRDTSGYTLTTGSSTAYNMLTAGTYPAHAAGMVFLVRAHVACGNNPTFQVNALAAKNLKRQGGGAIVTGDIAVNQLLFVAFNPALDCYECIGIGDGSPSVPSYTVAGLPMGAIGQLAYASNGRKNGEGSGSGTGVLVFKDATAWRACDTGATVAA